MKIFKKNLATVALITSFTLLTGCATSQLLENDNSPRTETVKKTKSQDQVIAFGKPSTKLANMPNSSIVFVGEKYSYVMSKGGTRFVNLMSKLDSRYFQVDKGLEFISKNDGGSFSGTINLSYVKLKDEITRDEIQFFLQNSGKECTTNSDKRINAQRFCFDIDIKGVTYPKVNNYNMVQSSYSALSKPYTITIYTTSTRKRPSNNGNLAQKLVMLPFAIAFDVVTLPLQILE